MSYHIWQRTSCQRQLSQSTGTIHTNIILIWRLNIILLNKRYRMQSVSKICTYSIFQLYHPFDIFLYLFEPFKKSMCWISLMSTEINLKKESDRRICRSWIENIRSTKKLKGEFGNKRDCRACFIVYKVTHFFLSVCGKH